MNIYTYHYTYEITNLNPITDEKYYIGVHSDNSLDNTYLGSSKYLDLAVNKQGKEYFQKDILHLWQSRELAEAHEEWLHGYINVATNPVWINANTFICPHCDKILHERGNFERWHNDNCKHSPKDKK